LISPEPIISMVLRRSKLGLREISAGCEIPRNNNCLTPSDPAKTLT
jgi:hypothetical protein